MAPTPSLDPELYDGIETSTADLPVWMGGKFPAKTKVIPLADHVESSADAPPARAPRAPEKTSGKATPSGKVASSKKAAPPSPRTDGKTDGNRPKRPSGR